MLDFTLLSIYFPGFANLYWNSKYIAFKYITKNISYFYHTLCKFFKLNMAFIQHFAVKKTRNNPSNWFLFENTPLDYEEHFYKLTEECLWFYDPNK